MIRFVIQTEYSCISLFLFIQYLSLSGEFPSLSSVTLSFILPFRSIPPPVHFSFSLLCYACFWRRVWPPAVLLTQHLLPHSFYPFTPSHIPSSSSSLLLLSHSPFLFTAFNLYIQWISKPLSLLLFCSFFLSLPLSYLFSGICLSVVAQ